MLTMISRWMRDESGATSIEYSLIAAFIGLGLIVVVPGVGDEIVNIFTDVEQGFKNN